MPEENAAPDLFDLKFLPAWVKEEPRENPYANFAGEDPSPPAQRDRRERPRAGRETPPRAPPRTRARGGRGPGPAASNTGRPRRAGAQPPARTPSPADAAPAGGTC